MICIYFETTKLLYIQVSRNAVTDFRLEDAESFTQPHPTLPPPTQPKPIIAFNIFSFFIQLI